MSPLLPHTQVHHYHLSRFHIYVLICNILFFFKGCKGTILVSNTLKRFLNIFLSSKCHAVSTCLCHFPLPPAPQFPSLTGPLARASPCFPIFQIFFLLRAAPYLQLAQSSQQPISSIKHPLRKAGEKGSEFCT